MITTKTTRVCVCEGSLNHCFNVSFWDVNITEEDIQAKADQYNREQPTNQYGSPLMFLAYLKREQRFSSVTRA